MGRHILALNFIDSTNEGILLIDDISIYDPQTTLINGLTSGTTCVNLQITPPGYTYPTVINVNIEFRLILSACAIGIVPSGACSEYCPPLPDGMYNIRYAVPPTDQVNIEYKIMRITKALNRYYGLLCKLDLQPCLPDKETEDQLKYLNTIYNFLLSAKLTVENLHQYSEGMNMYRYAVSLMDKMSYGKPRC